MGFYVYADTRMMALRKAKKQRPADRVVTRLAKTRNKGLWYAVTKERQRVYSRGDYQPVVPKRRRCMFCRTLTTRQEGLLGHYVCSKCSRKYTRKGK